METDAYLYWPQKLGFPSLSFIKTDISPHTSLIIMPTL